MKLHSAFLLASVLLASSTTICTAQEVDGFLEIIAETRPCATPDCLPPVLESECDQYDDNRVKGLCNAYCHANDCDDVANAVQCDAIKANFVRLTGIPDLPCEVCPCWTSEDLTVFDQTNIRRARITENDSIVRGASRFPAFSVEFVPRLGVNICTGPGFGLVVDEGEKLSCLRLLQKRLVDIGVISAEPDECPCFTAEDLDRNAFQCFENTETGHWEMSLSGVFVNSSCQYVSAATRNFTIIESGMPGFEEYASDAACRSLIDAKCCELGLANLGGNCPPAV